MGQTTLLVELSRFVQRISAIARTGLAFSPDGFDAERYEELLREAARMSTLLSGEAPNAAEELFRQWRASVGYRYDG